MGIDRIGKGGGTPPIETPDVQKKGAVDKPFSVEPTETKTPVAAADAVSGASPLARLRAGEIDVDGYVDLKVDEATRGLEGLSPTELSDIKSMLREQITTDPSLQDLVRSAAGGQVPSPPSDD